MKYPKCIEQKEFEGLASELLKVLATLDKSKQIKIFEYVQHIAFFEQDKKQS